MSCASSSHGDDVSTHQTNALSAIAIRNSRDAERLRSLTRSTPMPQPARAFPFAYSAKPGGPAPLVQPPNAVKRALHGRSRAR
jgi:hypothetical protein